ncbi:outer membrane beta-barrel protein [Mucilaginibacter litoreus]|uniref:Outer membrane beta-barrel protein n=1 Tax=Mucilaginibacter litoreus TaxID=1048221 RepID=A0ABW3ASR6_9SPHI
MTIKFGGVLTAILVSLFNFCFAQKGSSLHGKVMVNTNQPAAAATAILISLPDSSIIKSALVDAKGAYRFFNIKQGTYTVLATMLGYKQTYSGWVNVTRDADITVPDISLPARDNGLKEVSIIAKKPYVEVRPGKLIINPAASIIADGQSVLDILSQSPGVRVDNNDNISITGRQQALILIDGKATNLSGADLASLLKGAQGSNVERMEVITGGSPKYDAAAGGIINIIYKKGKNIGTNGTFTASAGYGRYAKGSTGISFNNRTVKYNVFGSYNLSANKTYKDFYTDRNITYQGVISSYNTDYTSVYKTLTHNFSIGTDYYLSANHTLGFLVSGNLSGADYQKHNNLDIYNKGRLDSAIKANSLLERDIHTLNYNLNYTGQLDKKGKTLAANLTYTTNSRHSDEYITNNFSNGSGNIYRDPLLLQNLSPTKMHNWSALLDYANPLPKDGRIEAGFKFSSTKTDNNLVFGPMVDNVYTSDPTFSNHFIFDENITAGYVNYIGKFGKLDVNAGIRGEYTRSKGNSVTQDSITNRNYFNLFPTVLFNYRYNDKNEYALTFTRGILRPLYDRLNPFLYFVDLYTYQSGNPYLRPEYTNNISLSHTYNQDITTKLYASFMKGTSFAFYQQNDASKVILNTQVNLGKTYVYGISVNAPIKFTSWWTSRYDIDASYQRYVADPQYGNLNKGTGDVIINTKQSFTISSRFGAELTGHYETPVWYGINKFKANYYLNAGISMQILNKLGKLSLTGRDIFKTNRDRAYTNYQNLDMRTLDRREYQVVTLSFSYRFGKKTVKKASQHTTGSEDEQRRMGN